ncbi:carbohydrate ABC transporter permease [Eubacteriales bacterium mix99]|jgi:putative aldouronate transport system permease protein|nr:sugar ABC transporter permease [Clostridiales bacterium]
MIFQHETLGDKLFRLIRNVILLFFCVIVLYPVIFVISASFSNPLSVMKNEVVLLPKGFTLIGYEKVFSNPDVWNSYKNTIVYTIVGTALNVILTSTGAFALSRKDFKGRNFWTFYITFTMFFSGGIIPMYLLIKQLNLYDTFWVMILPGAISAWNMIIMRTFFQSNVPMELQEAAIIDGCNDLVIFLKIALPLSMPIIAIMTLFYGVDHWNSFFGAMLYLSDRDKFPLQLILREILLQNISSGNVEGPAADQQIVGESIRYALIIVATVPILLVYPFIQKYFVKGVLIGAIKG